MLTDHRLRTLEAAGVLAVTRFLIATLPFSRLSSLAGQAATSSPADDHAQPTRDSIGVAVGRAIEAAASRLPWHSTCLVRALAGRFMLRLRGVPSTLVFGVASENGAFRAHAWLLSRGGTVCGGREAAGYTTIAAVRPHPR